VAIPADGIRLYRAVKTIPPSAGDFQQRPSKWAREAGATELQRIGISAFYAPEQAAGVNQKGYPIAGATIAANPRILVARTDLDRPGHVDIFVSMDVLAELDWQPAP